MTAALPTVRLILIRAVLTAVSDRIDLLILAYHALLLRIALRLLSTTTCYNKKKSVLIIYSSIIKCLISSRREGEIGPPHGSLFTSDWHTSTI